jgi:hypothetical protein
MMTPTTPKPPSAQLAADILRLLRRHLLAQRPQQRQQAKLVGRVATVWQALADAQQSVETTPCVAELERLADAQRAVACALREYPGLHPARYPGLQAELEEAK